MYIRKTLQYELAAKHNCCAKTVMLARPLVVKNSHEIPLTQDTVMNHTNFKCTGIDT